MTATFQPIVLTGPPGAGKSTVGGILAAQLGTAFTDTDAAVEAVAGKPVADIFISDGEPEFRRLERDAVEAALDGRAAGVIGLGGGAVMDPQTGFTELAKRVGLDRARPLLIGTSPRAQLKALLEQRLPVYEKLAWLTVSTDGRDPAGIAAEIAAAVADAGR
jgi:shikimate kinase